MKMKLSNISRRTFIGTGAAALSSEASAAGKKPRPERGPGEPLRIGLINGEWSHSENCWIKLVNGLRNDDSSVRFAKRTGMYYTHVWHIDSDKAEQLAQKYAVPHVVKSFDAMVGKVDAVIIDTVFQAPWTYKLARPYLEAGIPVYIDRPFTDALWKAREMLSLSKKHNTPIFSGSSLEHMYTAYETIKHNPPERILGYETWSEGSDPYDFYTHGVHGLWWSYRTAGGGIHAIAHKTKDWSRGGGTSTLLYKDRGSGPFIGTVHHQKRDECIIYTKFTGKDRIFRCEYKINWDNFIWTQMLFYIQDVFAKRFKGLIDTPDKMMDKSRLFLAGFRSLLREDGGFVELDTLDEDWAVGCPWGQTFYKSTDDYRAYTKLFGPEKGELQPLD